jgi:Na+-translocating ferredoxin:NAD+ oxidoreductase subunit B
MDALDLSNFVPQVWLARCIGCGLCVSSCPSRALSLVRKEEDERPSIPETTIMTHLQLGRARGKLKVRDLIMVAVRSKVDRLLAVRPMR